MYKNTKRLTKISTVKEEVERAKYSELIIGPLIKYIYFRIKSKLERKELMYSSSVFLHSSDSTYQFTTTIDDDQVSLEILDPGPEVSKGEQCLLSLLSRGRQKRSSQSKQAYLEPSFLVPKLRKLRWTNGCGVGTRMCLRVFNYNGPVLTCLLPLCQNEASCKTIHVKMRFPLGLISMKVTSFHFERFCTRIRFETETQGTRK